MKVTQKFKFENESNLEWLNTVLPVFKKFALLFATRILGQHTVQTACTLCNIFLKFCRRNPIRCHLNICVIISNSNSAGLGLNDLYLSRQTANMNPFFFLFISRLRFPKWTNPEGVGIVTYLLCSHDYLLHRYSF